MTHRRTFIGMIIWIVAALSFIPFAHAQPPALGIGRGDGLEVGIRLDALNQLRADSAVGVYDRPCAPEEHDPNLWHTLVNVERRCHYDHHHGDDPHYVADLFGAPGAFFGQPGKSISYPWQTFTATQEYESNAQAIAERRMENDLKHEGYIWIVRRDQPCPDGYCITDFRLQTHAIFGAHDAPVRYHSYSFEARVCADAAQPNTCGIVRVGGWVNTGRLFITNPDDPGCGFGQELIHIPLPADSLFTPVDTDNIDESRCHSTLVNDLPAVPGDRPLAEWWTHSPGDRVRFQLRNYDPLGNIDPADPARWQLYCDAFSGDCPYDQSMFTAWIGYVLKVRGENFGSVFIDIDPERDAIANYRGYADRWGGMVTTCAAPGLDCVPLEYTNVHLDPFFRQFGEGAFVHTICEACPKVDYDLSPQGVNWLTWFERYAQGGHGGHGTPAPQPTTDPTPVPSAEPTSQPTALQVRMVADDMDIQIGDSVTVDLVLDQPAGSPGIQGIEAICTGIGADIFELQALTGGGLFGDGSITVGPRIDGDRLLYSAAQAGDSAPITTGGTLLRAALRAAQEGMVTPDCQITAIDGGEAEITIPFVGIELHVGHASPTEPPPEPTATPVIEPTPQPTPVTTPEPMLASLSGIVLLSHAPDADIAVALQDAQGSPAAQTTTDAGGAFAFANLPPGDYTITASAPGYLSARQTISLANGAQHDLGSVTLIAGDVVADNVIDELDVVQLGAYYAADANQESADLNRSGRVSLADLRALARNLRRTGPLTWEQPPT